MRNNKGFTLVETMAVIAIIAIITVIAVPGFRTMQANTRLTSVSNQLASALREVRSEALVQRRNMQFTAVSGKTGSQLANNFGSQGWQIASVNNGVLTVRQEQRNIPSTVTVSTLGTRTAPASIFFIAATGQVALSDAAPYQPVDVIFTVCDKSVDKGASVMMTRLGRVSVQKHTTSAACAGLR